MDNAMQEVTEKALSIPEQAKAIVIIDNASYEKGANILLTVKDLRRQIDEVFDPIIKKAHEAHKEAVAQKKKVDAPLQEAENYLKPQMSIYLIDEERKRKEKEERLRAEALKKEEEERLAFASELEVIGAKEEAEAVIEEPIYVPPVILPKTTPKVSGIALTKTWTWELIDFKKVPDIYKKLDEIKINGVVKAMKSACNIPGIRIYEENNIRAGRK